MSDSFEENLSATALTLTKRAASRRGLLGKGAAALLALATGAALNPEGAKAAFNVKLFGSGPICVRSSKSSSSSCLYTVGGCNTYISCDYGEYGNTPTGSPCCTWDPTYWWHVASGGWLSSTWAGTHSPHCCG